MQGYKRWWLISILGLLSGCRDIAPPEESSPLAALAVNFDPANTGTLRGRVAWEGELPKVPPFDVYTSPDSQPDSPTPGPRANPHAPHIDAATKGVADAVIFLRQVDLAQSRPWDHEPVNVEHHAWTLRIKQGPQVSRVGFVRRGEEIVTESKQKILHILRGDGAAFFSLPLPDAEVSTGKRLDRIGHVELGSGAAYYWMRAHLFVAEHPYYARSDAQGNWQLPQVPAGTYEVVCWLPNWHVAWRERDPESSQVSRLGFATAGEIQRQITVSAGATKEVSFAWGTKDFQ